MWSQTWWKRNDDNNDLKERRVNTEIEELLKVENTSLTFMNEIYKKQIDELKKLNTRMAEQFVVVKKERDELKSTLYTRDHELAIARLANDDLKEKVAKIGSDPLKDEVLGNTIIKLNREKMDLLERLDDRDSEIHDLKGKIISLEQENAYYRRQDHHVQTAIKDLIEKLQAEKK